MPAASKLNMEIPDLQRVTLSRGCDQCIKVKRKCSRDVPSCQRCLKRRNICRYKNQPLQISQSNLGDSFGQETSAPSSGPQVRNFEQNLVADRSSYFLPSCVLSNMSELNGMKINVLSLDQQTVAHTLEYLRCVSSPISSLKCPKGKLQVHT